MGLSNRIPGDLQACGLERSAGFPTCCIAVLPACEPWEFTRARCFREPADWKSAIQQVGKPALICGFAVVRKGRNACAGLVFGSVSQLRRTVFGMRLMLLF